MVQLFNEYFVFVTLASALAALIFAFFAAKRVLGFDEGTDKMKKISAFIRIGANAYLKRQYRVVAAYFAVMFVILLIMFPL